jgi:hypothetical protein
VFTSERRGVFIPDRRGVLVSGECNEVLLSLFDIHSCPLLSLVPSVNERAVCVSHPSSTFVCSRRRELLLICAPKPSDVKTPDWVLDRIWSLFLRRVREADREPGFERIPPGEGSAAMWEREDDVWRSEVEGS